MTTTKIITPAAVPPRLDWGPTPEQWLVIGSVYRRPEFTAGMLAADAWDASLEAVGIAIPLKRELIRRVYD